jgi:hypothetical protein
MNGWPIPPSGPIYTPPYIRQHIVPPQTPPYGWAPPPPMQQLLPMYAPWQKPGNAVWQPFPMQQQPQPQQYFPQPPAQGFQTGPGQQQPTYVMVPVPMPMPMPSAPAPAPAPAPVLQLAKPLPPPPPPTTPETLVPVKPTQDEQQRDYSVDKYFEDSQLKAHMTAANAAGPSIWIVRELPLIPLMVSSSTRGSKGGYGSIGPMQFRFQDAPKTKLSPDQDAYFAGIVLAYSLLLGFLPVSNHTHPAVPGGGDLAPGVYGGLEQSLRAFDVDEDSIAVVESQLETLLYNVSDKQHTNLKPLLYIFPIHDRYLSLTLRLYVYGDVMIDPKTKQKQVLGYYTPFTWRHALPTGRNRLRLRGEAILETSEEFKLREEYHRFLVRLYRILWRTLMRTRIEATNLQSTDYARFVESTLTTLAPELSSVAVLEARVRAIAARFQLIGGKFFNTAAFYTDTDKLRSIMDPIVLNLIGKYLFFKS